LTPVLWCFPPDCWPAKTQTRQPPPPFHWRQETPSRLTPVLWCCPTARFLNAGQSCIAAKRIIVLDGVYEKFLELFVGRARQEHLGDPLSPKTTIGPLARRDVRDRVHDQVQRTVQQGARCLLGGELPEGRGWYYPPTVLAEVLPGMTAFEEEVFGPVAVILRAKNEEEAIEWANRSRFGLGAAVFSRDLDRAAGIARERLEAGSCFVNDFVRSDPRFPFGGVKESGFGRELSCFGIQELVNIKTVCVAQSAPAFRRAYESKAPVRANLPS
jgi:succinate-semialdehyde dehydrogenase/glutarate-semialdehyde dehydrogenase